MKWFNLNLNFNALQYDQMALCELRKSDDQFLSRNLDSNFVQMMQVHMVVLYRLLYLKL